VETLKCFDCKKPADKTFTNGATVFHICEKCYEENIELIGMEFYLKH
jgi:hypothetical protein